MSQEPRLFENKLSLPQSYSTAGMVGYKTLDVFDAVCSFLTKLFRSRLSMLIFFVLKSLFEAEN